MANAKQNFEIPNGMTLAEYVASEIKKSEAKTKRDIAKFSSNKVALGVTVVDLEFKQGNEILDKETKKPLLDESGEVKRYATKFYATFSFQGGNLRQEVKESDYVKLVMNKKYYCQGYLGEVNNYGNKQISPIFNTFEEIELD